MQRAEQNRYSSVGQHLRNAEAYLADGDHRSALADLDLAFLAAPDDPAVRLLRGRTLSMLGRDGAALAELDAAIALDYAMADAWVERAAIYLYRADWSTAETDCSRALEIDASLVRASHMRGIARYRQGSLADASEDLRRALDREPNDPSAHYWRGLALRDSGDNHAALSEFDAAIHLNDHYTAAYVARGKARANLGDMAAARSDWAIAAQMLHHSH